MGWIVSVSNARVGLLVGSSLTLLTAAWLAAQFRRDARNEVELEAALSPSPRSV
jgi:hypothetical protein